MIRRFHIFTLHHSQQVIATGPSVYVRRTSFGRFNHVICGIIKQNAGSNVRLLQVFFRVALHHKADRDRTRISFWRFDVNDISTQTLQKTRFENIEPSKVNLLLPKALEFHRRKRLQRSQLVYWLIQWGTTVSMDATLGPRLLQAARQN